MLGALVLLEAFIPHSWPCNFLYRVSINQGDREAPVTGVAQTLMVKVKQEQEK